MDLNHGTTVHVGKLDIRSTDLIIYHINLTLRIRYIVIHFFCTNIFKRHWTVTYKKIGKSHMTMSYDGDVEVFI